MSWIQTYTGKKFDLLDPKPDMICIEDIAHALSNICRFTGHTKTFYSVAQHSILVAETVPSELAFEGLMHDATEAYVADLSTPLKALVPGYRDIEAAVWAAITAKFGLPYKLHPEVKRRDAVALMTERRDLLMNPNDLRWTDELEALETYPFRIRGLGPIEAELAFMQKFRQITNDRRVV